MEHIEARPTDEQKEGCGVLDYHIKNNHFVVSVRWKDGIRTVKHFPVAGFTVVDPVDHRHLGNIGGEKALEILKQHAGDYEYQKFSWRDFM